MLSKYSVPMGNKMTADYSKQIAFLTEKRAPVERYLRLQIAAQTPELFFERDLQRQFNAFYRVRIGTDKHENFFRTLVDASDYQDIHEPLPTVAYWRVVTALRAVTGRTEASFASKIVATVNAHAPVIDSILLKHFGLKRTPPKWTDERVHLENIYTALKHEIDQVASSETGRAWIQKIDTHFGGLEGWELVTPTKKVDLYFWASRSK